MRLETWEEDGPGPAHGFFVRLPSGRVVLLQQLAYAVEHFGKQGPDVFVDSDDVVNIGVAALSEKFCKLSTYLKAQSLGSLRKTSAKRLRIC